MNLCTRRFNQWFLKNGKMSVSACAYTRITGAMPTEPVQNLLTHRLNRPFSVQPRQTCSEYIQYSCAFFLAGRKNSGPSSAPGDFKQALSAYLKLMCTHLACIVCAMLPQNPRQSTKDCPRVWLPLTKNLTVQSAHAEFRDRLLDYLRIVS